MTFNNIVCDIVRKDDMSPKIAYGNENEYDYLHHTIKNCTVI